MDRLIFTLIGILGGVAAKGALEAWLRIRAARSRKRDLLSTARKLGPTPFVAPRCTWQHDGTTEVIESEADLHRILGDFTRSSAHFMMLSGAYGMGKTILARYLTSQIAESPAGFGGHLPILINSRYLTTDAIAFEVTRHVNSATGSQLAEGSLAALMNTERWLLVFDALDQLPYKAGERNRLDAIVDFVQQLLDSGSFEGKLVLVARDEFLSLTAGLDALIKDGRFPHLRVEGFVPKQKVQQFIGLMEPGKDSLHWAKLGQLLDRDEKMVEVFSRPITLARYMAIPESRLASVACTGTTIAEVFRLSVAGIPDEQERQLEDLAYQMFVGGHYYLNLGRIGAASALTALDAARRLAGSTDLIEIDQTLCQFRHAAYRDFFVAMKYLRSIRTGQPQHLGIRQNNYLVSEFVAGLLDEQSIIELLSQCQESGSTEFKINVLDVLAELENARLRALAKEYLESQIAGADAGDMNEYKVGLYTSAGVLGFPDAVDALIAHVKSVGIKAFFEYFFPTKNNFEYYEYSSQRCESEWVNVAAQRKYGEQRRLAVFLLGEMCSVAALPTLRRIADDSTETLRLRTTAAAAVRSVVGEGPAAPEQVADTRG